MKIIKEPKNVKKHFLALSPNEGNTSLAQFENFCGLVIPVCLSFLLTLAWSVCPDCDTLAPPLYVEKRCGQVNSFSLLAVSLRRAVPTGLRQGTSGTPGFDLDDGILCSHLVKC